MDFSLQQDRSCDCSDAARRSDLGDARDLCCRISFGVLEHRSSRSPARALSPIWTARLRALACMFTGRLAHLLARACWVSVLRDSYSKLGVFCYSFAD